jgi:2,4-dienoyl-CoA reductase-like NADH-dependent reductase (Old Yellow Enzyme family)
LNGLIAARSNIDSSGIRKSGPEFRFILKTPNQPEDLNVPERRELKMNTISLASSLRIGAKTAQNRIVNQPMECNDADAVGNPTDRTFARYRNLARGGAGIIIVESMTITYESRARKKQLRISEETAPNLERLVREMKAVNPNPLILFQIMHSGRFSHKDFSKAVSLYPTEDPSVHVLTCEEIDEIGSLFAKAALLAKQVGADGIDFKHCHGYLCAEMLRPANTRDDRFGQTFENRTRFFRETSQKIRNLVGSGGFLLGVRFSIYEGIPGGFGTSGPEEVIEDLAEPLAFAKMTEECGMDYINVSAGVPLMNIEFMKTTPNFPEGVYRHFGWTKFIKAAVTIPVIGSGYSYLRDGKNGLNGADAEKKSFLYWAIKNLRDGNVDLVGIGRQSLADPVFANKILAGSGDEIHYCRACGGCTRLLVAQRAVGCAAYDPHYKKILQDVGKRS